MAHLDPTLKQYADIGLRSATDWLTMGREVNEGAPPRAQATHLRAPADLYTRDQTRPRRRAEKPARATTAPAPA